MAGLQFKKIGFYHKRKYAVCNEAVESKLENILRYSDTTPNSKCSRTIRIIGFLRLATYEVLKLYI